MTKAKNKVTKRNKGKKFKFNYSNQNKVETKGSVFAQMASLREESKKKAEQRRERLISEYKNQLNQNEFRDLRNTKFIAEKPRIKREVKQFSKTKKSKFLLSDSDDDGDFNNLSLKNNAKDQFQEEVDQTGEKLKAAHFIDQSQPAQGEEKKRKSRKERLQEIIAKSKYEKNQKAMKNQEQEDTRLKVNKEFVEVAMLLQKRSKMRQLEDDSDDEEGQINSAYDLLQQDLLSFKKEKAIKNVKKEQKSQKEKKEAKEPQERKKNSALREIGSEDQETRNMTKSQRIKQTKMKELEKEGQQKNFASVMQNYLENSESQEGFDSEDEGSASYQDESSSEQD